mgnify:CR=1 FL=1
MRWTMEDVERHQKRVKNGRNKNKASGSASVNKSNPGGKSLEKKADPRFNGPVDITVISYLYRLRDADGCFSKYAIDGIVSAGILRGDSLKEIREIRHSQKKVGRKSDEKTEIIIKW